MAGKDESGFTPLVDSKTLDGWDVVRDTWESWAAEDNMIVCNGKERGWLRTARTYRNFVLRLEYAIGPQGNSGVFLRSQVEGRPAYNGMEIQILDDHGAPVTKTCTGALYDAVAPTKNMARPAWEWNALEATCDGPHVVVILNGEWIVDVDLDSDEALRGRPREGYIGLQNHHSAVKFRGVCVKEL